MQGYTVQTGAVALSAAATKSLWLIAPNASTISFLLTEISVSFDASAAGQAIRVELYRVTTLGSPAGTTATFVKRNDAPADAVQSSGLTALSAEPTTVEILRPWYVAPNGGLLIVQYPLGREPGAKAGGGRIGLRVVTPSGVSPNAVAYVEIEE